MRMIINHDKYKKKTKSYSDNIMVATCFKRLNEYQFNFRKAKN